MARTTPGPRHIAESRWITADAAICGVKRAPGVKIVKNRRQGNCPTCVAGYDARVAEAVAGLTKRRAPAFTR